MIPKEQTRIGKGGNCFATALASILETPIPEFGFSDDYWQRVRAYLAKRGLAYKRVPLSQRPQGYSTIEGISPRGGLHACVAKNGKFVHDPHPVSDDPRRGLAEPQYYGELMPLSNYRERLHRALDRAMDGAAAPAKFKVGQTVSLSMYNAAANAAGFYKGESGKVEEATKTGKGSSAEWRYKVRGLWFYESDLS
jgi:hypothetical protein